MASHAAGKRRASKSPDRSPPRDRSGSFARSDAPSPLGINNPKRLRITVPPGHADSALTTATTYASSRNETRSTSNSSNGSGRVILLNRSSSPSPKPGTPGYKFQMITALCSQQDILLAIVRNLSPRTLVYLYSISAPFYYHMNSNFTQYILAATKGWSPDAELYYPWRCYKELCIDDPGLRKAGRLQRKKGFFDRDAGLPDDGVGDRENEDPKPNSAAVRAVPSFRWLKMVVYREIIVREIISWLGVRGHRTPVVSTVDAVKKLWFLMDIPVTVARTALIHNTAYFTNANLKILNMFLMKLDMCYTEPVNFTGGEGTMRRFLLQERTLTTMWNFLRGAEGASRLEMLVLWVKHGYKRPPRYGPETRAQQIENDQKVLMPIMGIAPHLVGRWGYECWGLGAKRLMRPDELIVRESVRREMRLEKHYFRFMKWGYLHPRTLRPMPPSKAENVVFSLMKRKQNELAREREQEAQRAAEEYFARQ